MIDVIQIARELLPPRPKDAHKKSHGRVLIVAGSKGMTGAAVLCAKACMRAGSGYVTLAFPESLKEIFHQITPEVLTLALPATSNGSIGYQALKIILEKETDFDVLVLGPGISRGAETLSFAIELIKKTTLPLVLDADGLYAAATNIGAFKEKKNKLTILTPHKKEMARLAKVDIGEIHERRQGLLIEKAVEWNVYLVLKGYNTLVVSPNGETFTNTSGGPELATAGTGDVLSGIIASILAANLKKPYESIALAVYLHGLAGAAAAEKFGERSVMAADVIELFPTVLVKILAFDQKNPAW